MKPFLFLQAIFLCAAVPGHCTVLHVPSQYSTIQAGINAAAAGDTVEVACGNYSERGIDMRAGICVRSESGTADCASIRAWGGPIFGCHDLEGNTIIEGFTLSCPEMGGICIESEGSALTILNCIFHDNRDRPPISCEESSTLALQGCLFSENSSTSYAAGIEGVNSSLVLTNCSFMDNYGFGTFECFWSSVSLTGCTFSGNASGPGSSIRAAESELTATGCTFSHDIDAWDGSIYIQDSSTASLVNCNITFNYAFGLRCDATSEATLTCCNIYGNHFDWEERIADQYGINGNISEDPLYCDPVNKDFTLQTCSPCRPFSPPNPECDLIGAWSVGCGGTPVQSASWGRIKALFRE